MNVNDFKPGVYFVPYAKKVTGIHHNLNLYENYDFSLSYNKTCEIKLKETLSVLNDYWIEKYNREIFIDKSHIGKNYAAETLEEVLYYYTNLSKAIKLSKQNILHIMLNQEEFNIDDSGDFFFEHFRKARKLDRVLFFDISGENLVSMKEYINK